MLVHSYIYYELNSNIVTDSKWAQWAKELEQLQQDYPEESKQVEYYEDFKDWDGSSGAFLKFGENIKYLGRLLLDTSVKVVKSEPKIKPKKNSSAISLF